MAQRIDGQAATTAIEESGWRTQFAAYDEGNVSAWMDEDGEVIAAARWDDHDADGISFFETRWHGCGAGARIIRALQAERPALHISGELDSASCARFWAQVGMLDGETAELFDGTVVRLSGG